MENNGLSVREEGSNERVSGSERRGGGSSENDEDSDEEEQQFDISLAASHSYMGNGLVQVSGRSVLEAGWTGRVPVIAHHGAVFPGETVPMLLTNERDAAVISRAIQHDKLFGLLCPDETGTLVCGYGVLCEVFEADAGVGEREGEGPRSLSFKARATHRFRCVPKQPAPIHVFSRMRVVEVCVLPEVRLGDPLAPARLASLDALRRARTPLDARLRSMDAAVTPWPLFVYDIFDYRRMRQIIEDYFRSLSLENLPEEAVSLSFWTASNLALSARDRLALFAVDDTLLRLHMEVRLIARKSVLCCSSCAVEIARREHIFAMSSEGVHSNYTNIGGYMHDIVTVSCASNTELSGAPSAEFSWFPGYTWTIALCAACLAHVGWRFDAQRRGLRPQQFYGLCRNYVQPRSDEHSPPARPGRSLSAELRAARRALSELDHRERRDRPPS
ncbi:protein cereblon-like isoform X2 [Nymphalis io]|uniref:protein cereblon-like isoform X2 n=1 Tax=Inachis io TaxID=171585 RepID=UPI002166F967|nr:protein cereblon-like isoform X2 [Nymphalis io]